MTDDVLDLTRLPSWVNWIAQDADGTWWGYSVEPLQADHGWYENEVGEHVRLGSGAVTRHWKATLQRIDNS